MSKPRNQGNVRDTGQGYEQVFDAYCPKHGWGTFFDDACAKCRWETKAKPEAIEPLEEELNNL